MKMIPDHLQAETVNGSNLRMMDQRHLPLQMNVVGFFLQFSLQRLPNTFPHFCSCRIGKCNHKKPVNVYRLLLIHNSGYDAFYQNGCLSGARRS